MDTQTNRARAPRATVFASAAAIAVAVAMSAVPMADAQSNASIRAEIDRTNQKIQSKQGVAQGLVARISSLSGRIDGIQGGITKVRQREARIQGRLDTAVARLRVIQSQRTAANKRLEALKERLVVARRTLAKRLLSLYQSDRPDLITVVLHSDGFARLVENTEFLRRIGQQDRDVITTVKRAKGQAAALEARLSKLEDEKQGVAASIKADRDEIASVRVVLEERKQRWAAARAARRAALQAVRAQTKKLKDHVDALEADIGAVTRQLRGSEPIPAGPIRPGSGRFIWPVNGPITAPFCERRSWESCHPGLDIGVPTGTPIRAAGAGTVQIASWTGGYGNYTCIGHGGGVSTCYGHQSGYRVSVGDRVSQGQVIGLSGSTGMSTGPHLHFEVRVNGSVTNPLSWL